MTLLRFLFPLLLFSFPAIAAATTMTATQGDVIEVTVDLPDATYSLHAFGKQWPVKRRSNGTLVGWIGVDMHAKPGNHRIEWRSDDKVAETDTLKVEKGEFPQSHITVTKKMAEFDAKALARIRADQKAIGNTYRMQVEANPDIRLPFMPTEGVISTQFGARRFVNGEPRSPHSGIDIAAPVGTPIKAPLAGKVLLVEDMFLNGKTMVIGHGNGLVSVYTHLNQYFVGKGDWVETGQKVAEIGMSGRTTGPHLHWGMRFNMAKINPLSLLPAPK